MSDFNISDVCHPSYSTNAHLWHKWRLVYEGGDCFINHFVMKFSDREDNADYLRRKTVTPSPDFAKAAVNDIKNAIFQRTGDITRRGGTKSYQEAIRGLEGGVDLNGSSMDEFVGVSILPELLSMAKVGIYVDMPEFYGETLADQQGKHPYCYIYRAEEIRSWAYFEDRPYELRSVLLTDWVDTCCETTGLPNGKKNRYRYLWVGDDGYVHVRFYSSDSEITDKAGHAGLTEVTLKIKKIPLVIAEISDSLLASTANHQVALVNLESCDLNYALKSNVPFYIEQYNPAYNSEYLREGTDGTKGSSDVGSDKTVRVGAVQGRRYPEGTDAPAFIHPSSEPMKASMEKQKQLKDDIRQLMNLAVANVRPKMASAESKELDDRGLESGLSYIGLVCQHAERCIANIWSMYEGKEEIATVKYPETYSLQSNEDRQREAVAIEDLRDAIPSPTYQKVMSKRIVDVLLGSKITNEDLDKIKQEIDAAPAVTANIELILKIVEAGAIDLKGAAQLFGIDEKRVELAAKEHADRLARIAEAQAEAKPEVAAGARGVPDASGQPAQDAKNEKTASRETDTDATPSDKTRGEGQ